MGGSRFGAMLCAIFVLFIGVAWSFGWIFDQPELLPFQAYWAPMVFNTALCCWLGGFALIVSSLFSIEIARHVQGTLAIAIFVIASAVMFEILLQIDLGIDWKELHRPLLSETAHPGRMAPNTALSMMLFGLGLMIHAYRNAGIGRKFGLAVAVLGFIGIVSYARLAAIGNADALQIPGAAGISVLLLGIGLMLLPDIKTKSTSVAAVHASFVLVMITVGLSAGAAGFFILAHRAETMISENLSHQAEDRIFFFRGEISARTEFARIASLNPQLAPALDRLADYPNDSQAKRALAELAAPLANYGFAAVAFEDMHGRIWPGLNLLQHESKFGVRLAESRTDVLLWSDGYLLYSRTAVFDRHAKLTGYLLAEQSLKVLNELREHTRQFGETLNMVVCSAKAEVLQCFPSSIESRAFEVPKFYLGERLPMSWALDLHQSGVRIARDYRGHRVLAAYGPISGTGLGLVLKIDLAEIYAPIQQQMIKAAAVLGVLILLGLWVMQKRLIPLIQDIDTARAEAEKDRRRFIAAAEGGLDSFYIFDAVRDANENIVDFRCSFINERGSRMILRESGEFVGKLLCEELPFAREAMHFDRFVEVVRTGVSAQDVMELKQEQFNSKWVERQVVRLGDGIAVTARDISAQKRNEAALREAERIQNAIIESASLSIIATNEKGIIISINKAGQRMLGYDARELIGKHTPELIHDREEMEAYAAELSSELGHVVQPRFEVFVAKAIGDVSDEREWTYVRKDGSSFPVRLSVTELRDADGQTCGYLGVAYDITEQRRVQDYMRHIAMHDPLTGLPNRVLFDDRLRVALERARRDKEQVAIALIDLDYFKQVNDRYGHQAGDALLRQVAERLLQNCRPSDTVARLGGDEFALILPAIVHPHGSRTVLHKIHAAMQQPITIAGHTLECHLSIGVCVFPEDGEDPVTLVRHADEAMYIAKAAGRNNFQIYGDVQPPARENPDTD